MANGDRVSAKLGLSTEVAGSSFGAQLAALQVGGGESSIGASFGSTLASGLTISGAWAKGSDMAGATDPATGMLVEAVPTHFRSVNIEENYMLDSNLDNTTVEDVDFDMHMAALLGRITAGEGETATQAQIDDAELAKDLKRQLFAMAGAPTMDMGCNPAADDDVSVGGEPADDDNIGSESGQNNAIDCGLRRYPATPGEDTRVAAVNHITDPSYFQVEIGYKFGNTGVAVSWYQSSDFQREGSSGTAIGIGARHTFPKAGADIYAAVQTEGGESVDAVKMTEGGESVDETVVAIGTKVSF